MNINRIYACQVHMNSRCKILTPGVYEMYGNFIKNALVYHKRNGKFIDLLSNEVYESDACCLNKMFVNTNNLIPIYDIIDVNMEKKNLSKKKVLKLLYNDAIKCEREVE